MTASKRTSPTREVQDVADRLHSAALHLLRRLRIEDDVLGVSPPRLSALSVVVFAGPLAIGALAAAEGVAAPTMTRLVDGLERDGFVRRRRDPADARGVLVEATTAGQATPPAGPRTRCSAPRPRAGVAPGRRTPRDPTRRRADRARQPRTGRDI